MIGRILRKFLGRGKPDQVSRELAAKMLDGILANEAATTAMLANARSSKEPFVLLTPVAPLPAGQSGGWFGGAPCLPDDVAWPEIAGEPLRFVCQIDLSALPQNIWSGLGPRTGWLAVFLHPEAMTPKVLRIDGNLRRRDGPGQAGAAWFWPRSSKDRPPVQAHSPRWPVMITGHVGELPPPKGWRKGKAPGFPDPRDARPPDLSDAAFHPFDEATLKVFLDNVQEHFSRQKMRIDAFLRTKLRGEDKTKLETMQLGATRSMERFLQVVEALAPFTRDFQPEPVQDLLKQITGIPSHHVRRLNDDEDGYVVLKSSILPMSEKPDPSFGSSWHYYADRLYRHAVCAYTQAPETLPPALRARMETIWRFEAPYEAGAMGHAPIGHVYTPHGPGTSNVVLLELPTSDMAGWIWGDMYSIVLFINRNDLAHGNFSKVTFEITN